MTKSGVGEAERVRFVATEARTAPHEQADDSSPRGCDVVDVHLIPKMGSSRNFGITANGGESLGQCGKPDINDIHSEVLARREEILRSHVACLPRPTPPITC